MTNETISVTEFRKNFNKHLEMIKDGNEIIITKYGKEVGRLIPYKKTVSCLTDSLIGIVKSDYDLEALKTNALNKKLGLTN